MPLVTEKIVSWPTVKPFDKQSVAVPGTKRAGQTAHYRNGIWGLIDEHTPNTLVTLDQIFEDGLKAGPSAPFLGIRNVISTNPLKYSPTYSWITYGEADTRRRYLGSALHKLFSSGELGGGELPTVGIWSMNRPEWQLVDIACSSYQKVSVSLYDTLGNDSVEYIIAHATVTIVFATADHIPTLLRNKPATPRLKYIVCIDKISTDASKLFKQWSESQGVTFKEFAEFEAFGKANITDPIPANPELIVSICYTSGTTNMPKGVILKHKNLAIATQGNLYGLELPEHAVLMSYLPLAHIYERLCELATIAIGGRIGYFTGDPLRLLEDAQILKPNFFPSVPRVLNRIYQAAMAGGNVPGLKGKLFRKALQTKLERLKNTGETTHALWDRLVFSKIQAVVGGQLALVSTGSAPISADVLNFLKIAFSCDVIEAATCSRSWPGDSTASGTVGPPGPTNEVKLIDVPAMGYAAEDKPNPRGELLIRGANCFAVYHNDAKNTKDTVDDEGWVHTGDVAEIDIVGRIKIIDRVKNIMKLAQGEYVALEKIENTYTSLPIIAQIYIHGDSLQSYLVAVVIPDPVQLSTIASKVQGKRVSPTDASALAAACEDIVVNKHVMSILDKNARKHGLKGFETIKRLHLSMVPFSIETNTLTPTMKIRRKDAYKFYKKEIDALYSLGEPAKL